MDLLSHKKATAQSGFLDDQFLIDLLVWYHLAWTGETVRRASPRLQALMAKASGFIA